MLDVELSDTVLSVKEKIFDRDGIPVQYLALTYAGHEMEDQRTLSDYAMKREDTIMYRVRMHAVRVPGQTPSEEQSSPNPPPSSPA